MLVMVLKSVLSFTAFEIKLASGIEFGLGNMSKAQLNTNTLAILEPKLVYNR